MGRGDKKVWHASENRYNDEVLEALKVELIEAQELAVDKEGKMLVWTVINVARSAARICVGGRNGRTCPFKCSCLN